MKTADSLLELWAHHSFRWKDTGSSCLIWAKMAESTFFGYCSAQFYITSTTLLVSATSKATSGF